MKGVLLGWAGVSREEEKGSVRQLQPLAPCTPSTAATMTSLTRLAPSVAPCGCGCISCGPKGSLHWPKTPTQPPGGCRFPTPSQGSLLQEVPGPQLGNPLHPSEAPLTPSRPATSPVGCSPGPPSTHTAQSHLCGIQATGGGGVGGHRRGQKVQDPGAERQQLL